MGFGGGGARATGRLRNARCTLPHFMCMQHSHEWVLRRSRHAVKQPLADYASGRARGARKRAVPPREPPHCAGQQGRHRVPAVPGVAAGVNSERFLKGPYEYGLRGKLGHSQTALRSSNARARRSAHCRRGRRHGQSPPPAAGATGMPVHAERGAGCCRRELRAGRWLALASADLRALQSAPADCHPQCKWQCDDPQCPAVCHPVCERPKCQMQCEEVSAARRSDSGTRATLPHPLPLSVASLAGPVREVHHSLPEARVHHPLPQGHLREG